MYYDYNTTVLYTVLAIQAIIVMALNETPSLDKKVNDMYRI